jgi:hypothetical protein
MGRKPSASVSNHLTLQPKHALPTLYSDQESSMAKALQLKHPIAVQLGDEATRAAAAAAKLHPRAQTKRNEEPLSLPYGRGAEFPE